MTNYEVLTDTELAAEWKVPKRAIQNLCRSNALLAFKIGDQWRITRSAAVAYSGVQS